MSNELAEKRSGFMPQPAISAAERDQLAALAAMSDDDVDTSDLPELGEDFWRNARRGRFYKPVKESTTIRVDADVLHWLKSEGRGYQTRINAILREAMMRDAPDPHS
ncbi:BrnA antitoxin family protein [Sphingobium boeckii]|uniref:Uncharacterized protein (DUF4415 family) n=1 Tax=Sphingobium boeckii TaxID=1082345 RepID=A0A7W9AIT6_9SPHN|nr:BrnA antitoxin family protein [Sphingobium boeckii]MBB5686274.1 uncharacterized protein (DUF4415 family) [Sphingobium boeckii]